MLGASAFLFSNVWLRDALEKASGRAMPQVVNSEGEPLQFLILHFPLLPSATPAKVRAALGALPALRQENDHFWNWVEDPKVRRKPAAWPPGAQSFVTTMEDGAIVLGNVELTGRTLTLSVNSPSRAERGRALLEPVLKGLVREPLVESQSLEEMMASAPQGRRKPPTGLSPEEECVIIHKGLDEHYARVLEEPLPALGNVSPMKAAKTAKGREKVVAWLKTLENHSARQPAGDPLADYDFTWLWEKLGVADRRR